MLPKVIIVTAPSGAGKTTIVKHLLSQFPKLAFSVSATTRTPRSGKLTELITILFQLKSLTKGY